MATPRMYTHVMVEVMQVPKEDSKRAYKDHEEDMRAIAQWLDANGAEITDYSLDNLQFRDKRGANWFLTPGIYIAKTGAGIFDLERPEDFERKYRPVVMLTTDFDEPTKYEGIMIGYTDEFGKPRGRLDMEETKP
jgi:hypothetical protein